MHSQHLPRVPYAISWQGHSLENILGSAITYTYACLSCRNREAMRAYVCLHTYMSSRCFTITDRQYIQHIRLHRTPPSPTICPLPVCPVTGGSEPACCACTSRPLMRPARLRKGPGPLARVLSALHPTCLLMHGRQRVCCACTAYGSCSHVHTSCADRGHAQGSSVLECTPACN